MTTFLILLGLMIALGIAWSRGARSWAFGFALAAVLPAITLTRSLPWWVWILTAVAVAGLVWSRQARSAGIVTSGPPDRGAAPGLPRPATSSVTPVAG